MLLFGLTTAFLLDMVQICRVGQRRWCFLGFKKNLDDADHQFLAYPGLRMTKTELQSALAEATQTDKRTAGVFLDALGALAYKEIKKTGEFVLPGFGKLVKDRDINCAKAIKLGEVAIGKLDGALRAGSQP